MDKEGGRAVVQRSFPEDGAAELGTLYLVGTPIGNLEDMTYRAVNILKEADWIAAEDTRHTRKLLNHFEIAGKLVSYHEHNKRESGQALLGKLLAGESVALVSDAGMPAISDPGAELVKAAVERKIRVVPVPGPNAALTALVASGLPTDAFVFLGFLPRRKNKALETLARWRSAPATMVLYEAPHRLAETLRLVLEAWGDRPCVLARELTKRYEEFVRGNVSSCLSHAESAGAKGEYVLLIAGADAAEAEADAALSGQTVPWWSGLSPAEHVASYMARENLDRKEAIKRAAADRNMSRRDMYNLLHRGGPKE